MAGAEDPDLRLAPFLFGKACLERLAGLRVGKGEGELDAPAATLADLGAERNVEPRLAAGIRQHLSRVLDGIVFELAAADGAVDFRRRHQHERAFVARGRTFGGGDLDDDDAVFPGEKALQTVLQKVHVILL